jgi:cytidylate kinase
MIIAVDGPMASGKGTISRALSARFNIPYLDTGSLYRATGLALINAGIDVGDEDACARLARTLDVGAINEQNIRTADVGAMASRIAVLPKVRDALFDVQRAFATQPGGAVLDGRDIGTVICPDADVKIYVIADAETRAQRRWQELLSAGHAITLDEMRSQTRERDLRDAARADAPMRAADDATLLDTSSLSIGAAIEEAVRLVENRCKA